MNSDMVKSEKFGHFHLVYHFAVPLREGGGLQKTNIEEEECLKRGTWTVY